MDAKIKSEDALYNHNGETINLTAIVDQCGINMMKAIKIFRQQTGLNRKTAGDIMYDAYKKTPPNRAKQAERKEKMAEHKEKMIEYKEELKEAKEIKANEPVKCPKCGSTSLSANKKGFGVGKAAVGAVLTGGIGLLAGGIGANKVIVTCLKCGHQFKPGK